MDELQALLMKTRDYHSGMSTAAESMAMCDRGVELAYAQASAAGVSAARVGELEKQADVLSEKRVEIARAMVGATGTVGAAVGDACVAFDRGTVEAKKAREGRGGVGEALGKEIRPVEDGAGAGGGMVSVAQPVVAAAVAMSSAMGIGKGVPGALSGTAAASGTAPGPRADVEMPDAPAGAACGSPQVGKKVETKKIVDVKEAETAKAAKAAMEAKDTQNAKVFHNSKAAQSAKGVAKEAKAAMAAQIATASQAAKAGLAAKAVQGAEASKASASSDAVVPSPIARAERAALASSPSKLSEAILLAKATPNAIQRRPVTSNLADDGKRGFDPKHSTDNLVEKVSEPVKDANSIDLRKAGESTVREEKLAQAGDAIALAKSLAGNEPVSAKSVQEIPAAGALTKPVVAQPACDALPVSARNSRMPAGKERGLGSAKAPAIDQGTGEKVRVPSAEDAVVAKEAEASQQASKPEVVKPAVSTRSAKKLKSATAAEEVNGTEPGSVASIPPSADVTLGVVMPAVGETKGAETAQLEEAAMLVDVAAAAVAEADQAAVSSINAKSASSKAKKQADADVAPVATRAKVAERANLEDTAILMSACPTLEAEETSKQLADLEDAAILMSVRPTLEAEVAIKATKTDCATEKDGSAGEVESLKQGKENVENGEVALPLKKDETACPRVKVIGSGMGDGDAEKGDCGVVAETWSKNAAKSAVESLPESEPDATEKGCVAKEVRPELEEKETKAPKPRGNDKVDKKETGRRKQKSTQSLEVVADAVQLSAKRKSSRAAKAKNKLMKDEQVAEPSPPRKTRLSVASGLKRPRDEKESVANGDKVTADGSEQAKPTRPALTDRVSRKAKAAKPTPPPVPSPQKSSRRRRSAEEVPQLDVKRSRSGREISKKRRRDSSSADEAEVALPATKKARGKRKVDEPKEDETVYCLCQKPWLDDDDEDMVACDGKKCPQEWFHYSCVDLKRKPKANEKFFCPPCWKKMPKKERLKNCPTRK